MTVQMVNGKSDKLNQDYLVLSKIGEGSFGEAFKAFSNIDGKEYAIKKSKEVYNGESDRK